MSIKQTKTSLVLSGGGALGLAHIGVLKNLEKKENIKINQIIGTSIGSLIGSLYAIKKTSTQMEEILKELNFLKLFEPSLLSKNSLIKTEKIYHFLQEKIGNIKFNELSYDLKIIATNLKTGEIKIFDKNNTPKIRIIQAICASICIPGIFSPYKIKTQYFIDGGLSSNLPIEFTTNKNIIASNVITQKYINSQKFSNSIKILEKSTNIFLLNQTKEKINRFPKNKNLNIIDITLKDFKSYEFHKWKKIIQKGQTLSKRKF